MGIRFPTGLKKEKTATRKGVSVVVQKNLLADVHQGILKFRKILDNSTDREGLTEEI